MKKLLILNDPYAYKKNDTQINIGDKALSEGLYNLIRASSNCLIEYDYGKNFPYLNIHKFDKYHKDLKSHIKVFDKWYAEVCSLATSAGFESHVYSLITKMRLFDNPVYNLLDKFIQAKYSRGAWDTVAPFLFRKLYSKSFMDKVDEADVILYNGRGIFADVHKFYLPMRLFEIYLALKRGKEVILVEHSFDIKDKFLIKMVLAAFKDVSLQLVRESSSRKNLLRVGLKKNTLVTCPDSALSVAIRSDRGYSKLAKKFDIIKGSIGLVIRGDREVDINNLSKFVKLLKERFNKKIYFIFTCKSFDKKVYDKLSKKVSLGFLDPVGHDETIAVMKKMDLVVSDRYHGTIFSILANTPILPLSANTVKMEGLFRLFKYPVKVYGDVSESNRDALLKDADFLIKNKKRVKSLLSKNWVMLRKKSLATVNKLSMKYLK